MRLPKFFTAIALMAMLVLTGLFTTVNAQKDKDGDKVGKGDTQVETGDKGEVSKKTRPRVVSKVKECRWVSVAPKGKKLKRKKRVCPPCVGGITTAENNRRDKALDAREGKLNDREAALNNFKATLDDFKTKADAYAGTVAAEANKLAKREADMAAADSNWLFDFMWKAGLIGLGALILGFILGRVTKRSTGDDPAPRRQGRDVEAELYPRVTPGPGDDPKPAAPVARPATAPVSARAATQQTPVATSVEEAAEEKTNATNATKTKSSGSKGGNLTPQTAS